MKRKHYTRYVMLCLLSIFIIGLMIIVPGCTQEEAIVEPEIPAHYTTYTDEAGLFSISYPPEWEPALSIMQETEEAVKDIIKSVESNLPVEKASVIFFAGVPTETGWIPSVNIVVEPLPSTVLTHAQQVEAGVRGIKLVIEDYHEFSRTTTTIEGREATIIDLEGTFPQIGKGRCLQLLMLAGRNGWCVTCTPPEGELSKWEEDFNAIVRSLRILK